MPSEQFERTLRERFAQAEIPPPAGLWDRIEAEVAPPVQPKRRFLWIWWSMAALLFCTVGLAWVFQPERPASAVDELVNTTPAIPAPQKQEVSEASVEANTSSRERETVAQPFLSDESVSDTKPAPAVTPGQSSLPPTTPDRMANISPTEPVSSDLPTSIETTAQTVAPANKLNQDNVPVVIGEETSISLFRIQEISPFNASLSDWDQTTAIIPVTRRKGFGKWAFDISAATGYATRIFTPSSVDKSFEADYAGYANRSAYSSNSNSQVATVRFPRWHHALSLETSRAIHPRWRINLGVELQAGLGGIATLGEIESPVSTAPGLNEAQNIIVEQSSIRLGTPSDFRHVSLGLPVRVSYLSTLGRRGSLEHSIGYSLNRGWTIAEPQSQLESIAFGLNTDQTAQFSGIPLPPPVLYAKTWHSDVRLRSRYFLPLRSSLQPFIGVELQSQISPAFGGDAGISQRSFLIGMELGIRIR